MLNKEGKLVTYHKDINATAKKTDQSKRSLKIIKKKGENYVVNKLESKVISPDWTEESENHVVKNLKKKKSCDPHGYSNELNQCGGQDVLSVITKLMNNIFLTQQTFSQSLYTCNITGPFQQL